MTLPSHNESGFSPGRIFVVDSTLRPFWRALIFIVLSIVLVTLIVGAMIGLFGKLESPLSMRGVIFYLVIDASLLLETWFLLSVFDHRSFRTLGIWFYPQWAREALAGIAVGTGLICVVAAGLVASGTVIFQGMADGPHLRSLVLSGTVLVLAAAAEEIAARGYGFQRLIDSIGRLGAVLVFSALFGAGHLGNPHVTALSTANTVLAGVLLAVTYLKTRALWMPIGLHWSWNFFLGPVFSLPVSGLPIPPLFRVQVSGPEWLSGGQYGPEGSVILTVACVATIVWLWRTKWIAPSVEMEEALK